MVVRIHVTLSEPTCQRLRDYASNKDVHVSNVVAQAVNQFLDSQRAVDNIVRGEFLRQIETTMVAEESFAEFVKTQLRELVREALNAPA